MKSIANYQSLLSGISGLLETARHRSARAVNVILTATYWEIGRRIVRCEQRGRDRAGYGEELIDRLAVDLSKRFGRGFTERNLRNMRQFYQFWPKLYMPKKEIQHSTGAGSLIQGKWHAVSAELAWTHYRRLLAIEDEKARKFYEEEAVRGGWAA